MQWKFCNTTAEDQEISEIPLSDHTSLNFHHIAILISFSTGSAAIALSLFLIWMHALNYTKPAEQKNIIRILLMVPIYAASNFLQLVYYHHAVYYAVISDCYEAFAISSFFSLMCQYVAPTLHDQKKFFRQLSPIRPWVWPLTWFGACCGGQRGPWRKPESGLTWFNIIWIGVYHYCFIRVSMTIVAVVSQHYKMYCESSMSPYFSHVWVLTIESIAVAIAMYCVIQYYVQFKIALSSHRPFLKVLAIKGVIFLSFWQSTAISIAATELNIITANAKLAYPDISTGIPAVLESIEMFIFAIVHIWAYPWQAYREDAPLVFYPSPTADGHPDRLNEPGPPQGGFMGLGAIMDALNFWDVIKAFGRGLRWLFCGVKRRHQDVSYQKNAALVDMDGNGRRVHGRNQHGGGRVPAGTEEGTGLISHAADPSMATSSYRTYEEEASYHSDLGYRGAHDTEPISTRSGLMGYPPTTPGYPLDTGYQQQSQSHQDDHHHSMSPDEGYPLQGPATATGGTQSEARPVPSDMQRHVGVVLWGQNPHQHPDGPMI